MKNCNICGAHCIRKEEQDGTQLFACGALYDYVRGIGIVACANTDDVMSHIKEDLGTKEYWPTALLKALEIEEEPECWTCCDSLEIDVRGVVKPCPDCCDPKDRIYSCSMCGGTHGQHAAGCGELYR